MNNLWVDVSMSISATTLYRVKVVSLVLSVNFRCILYLFLDIKLDSFTTCKNLVQSPSQILTWLKETCNLYCNCHIGDTICWFSLLRTHIAWIVVPTKIVFISFIFVGNQKSKKHKKRTYSSKLHLASKNSLMSIRFKNIFSLIGRLFTLDFW